MVFCQMTTGSVFPCAYSVLPDKTSESYYRMWGAINQELNPNQGNNYGPATIGMDFETAPANEFAKFWPNAKLVGCFFHWRKCLIENLSQKGCKKFYNQSPVFQELVNNCISMALVPLEEISAYFDLVEEKFEQEEENLCDGAIDYLTYFTRTYIGKKMTRSGGRRKPLFEHSSWNKYEEIITGAQITSNRVEAYNGAYSTRSDNKVSFWGMLEAFVREEAYTARKWREEVMNVRDQPFQMFEGNSRQIYQRDHDARIKNICLKAGTIPKSEYLSMLCVLVQTCISFK